jgi:hypothetical protein
MHQETVKSYPLHWPIDQQLCFTLVLIRYPYYGICISCISNIWSASGFIGGSSALSEVYHVFLIFAGSLVSLKNTGGIMIVMIMTMMMTMTMMMMMMMIHLNLINLKLVNSKLHII